MALWRQVAKTATPLPSTDRTAPVAGSDHHAEIRAPSRSATAKHATTKTPAREPQTLRPEGRHEPLVRHPVARHEVKKAASGAPGLDRNTARRLGRGALEPEARIDLHGMTADRAHHALTRFILSAHAGGKRCVLVITGKGDRSRDADPGHIRDFGGGVGVLKTLTPEWLRAPPLGGLVVGLFQAHIRHGGDGALYVYLRKNPMRG